jgi:hypothetical protein
LERTENTFKSFRDESRVERNIHVEGSQHSSAEAADAGKRRAIQGMRDLLL